MWMLSSFIKQKKSPKAFGKMGFWGHLKIAFIYSDGTTDFDIDNFFACATGCAANQLDILCADEIVLLVAVYAKADKTNMLPSEIERN